MKNLEDMSLKELWKLFPIILKEYNPEYIKWYSDEKENIINKIKQIANIYRINHIGSTSVPKILSKPIVDILLELEDGYDIKESIKILKKDGWLLMARDDSLKTIDFNKGYTSNGFAEKVYHLHIKNAGNWGELYFRDYLKSDTNAAKQYENLKINLMHKFEYNRDAYTNAKSDFIQKFTKIAMEDFKNRYEP